MSEDEKAIEVQRMLERKYTCVAQTVLHFNQSDAIQRYAITSEGFDQIGGIVRRTTSTSCSATAGLLVTQAEDLYTLEIASGHSCVTACSVSVQYN